MVLDSSGRVKHAVTITQGSYQYDMESGPNSMFRRGDDFFWAGWSNGFQTYYQSLEADSTNPKSDAWIYRYQFDRDYYSCLIQTDLSNDDVELQMEFFTRREVEDDNIIDIKTRESEFFKSQYRKDYYYAWTSKYSGGFSLSDSFIIPRPCAYKSTNLTQVDYYRGQKTYTYDIFRENDANTLTLMSNAKISYQTGEPTTDFAELDNFKNTVLIQTNLEDMVTVQKLRIRDCDDNNQLLEMNLYVNVLSNNYPDFVTEPETTWTMAVGDIVSYKLPQVVDPEGNDEPEVYVSIMEAQEDKYPPFLMF